MMEIHEDRKLSIYGKIQIINTLLVPKTINLAEILIPPKNVVNHTNSLMYRFLWHQTGLKTSRVSNRT